MTRQEGQPNHHEFTPDLRGKIKEIMNTSVWETMEALHLPAKRVNFNPVERDLPEPREAAGIRIDTWIGKLNERKDLLVQANPTTTYDICDDIEGPSATGLPALFEIANDGNKKRRMWAGTTITLAQKGIEWKNGDIQIPVYPISYSEWIACYNPEYAKVFKKNGLTLPYAGIGASVLMETTDGFFPLTRRGIETPVYPGRLYSPGGGPKPGQTSTEALLEEILEETGLRPGEHFDPSKITSLALVSDSRFANSDHSRPELVVYLPLTISYRAIEEIQHEQSVKKGLKETDVWGLEPVSTYPYNLGKKIVYAGNEMCPPTEAALSHSLVFDIKQKEGMETAIKTASGIISRIKSFERVNYQPSVKSLANF